MAKDDVIEIEGIVTDNLPNAMFKVDIGNGHTVLATISGKLRMNFIKILPGDKVTLQITITRPLRLMILHFSHMGLTDGLTFILFNLHMRMYISNLWRSQKRFLRRLFTYFSK